MNEHLTDRVRYKIMNEFAKTLELFDLSPLEARLFAYLYLSEEPKTLDEMSEALGKSKTSMSTSIRSLSDLNLVTLVWKKGVRKDLYKANDQLFKLFIHSYINKWIEATNHRKHALLSINKLLKKDGDFTEKDVITLDDQLSRIIAFHEELEDFFSRVK